MNITKFIGFILLASPFIVAAIFCLKLDGVKCLVFVFGGVALIIGIVKLGYTLINM